MQSRYAIKSTLRTPFEARVEVRAPFNDRTDVIRNFTLFYNAYIGIIEVLRHDRKSFIFC